MCDQAQPAREGLAGFHGVVTFLLLFQNFLYKCIGTTLGACASKDLVQKQLQELLETARYHEEAEREVRRTCAEHPKGHPDGLGEQSYHGDLSFLVPPDLAWACTSWRMACRVGCSIWVNEPRKVKRAHLRQPDGKRALKLGEMQGVPWDSVSSSVWPQTGTGCCLPALSPLAELLPRGNHRIDS